MTCLNGSHRRCRDRENCTCSICSPGKHRQANREAEDRIVKTHDVPPREIKHRKFGRPVSNDPKLIAQREYMREYRARKAAGEPTRSTPRYTDAQKQQMIRLRRRGKSLREIGEILGVDHTGVRYALRRLGAMDVA